MDEYNSKKFDSTGMRTIDNDIKYVVDKIGNYEIVIKVSIDDKYLGIHEIRINKDFRDYQQKMRSLGHYSDDEYYERPIDE